MKDFGDILLVLGVVGILIGWGERLYHYIENENRPMALLYFFGPMALLFFGVLAEIMAG